MKIKGIISADRPCECCGNTNLEKLVVIERDDGSLYYVGSTCAGYVVLGKKSRKNASIVTTYARAHQYAAKWVAVYGTSALVLRKIADAIRVRYCNCSVVGDEIVIPEPAN